MVGKADEVDEVSEIGVADMALTRLTRSTRTIMQSTFEVTDVGKDGGSDVSARLARSTRLTKSKSST